MLDIDQFKRINDLYGHLTGDRALKLAVDICCSALRAKDLIGRYGGEEFIVVLPETNLDEAQKIANRLRVSIEQTPLVTERGFDRITASFGVVCSGMFGCAAELEKMISVADQALYLAKGKGANQVVAIENPTHLIQERHESCAA
jgi:diguanylate cyclase (GGDEF)-like protein